MASLPKKPGVPRRDDLLDRAEKLAVGEEMSIATPADRKRIITFAHKRGLRFKTRARYLPGGLFDGYRAERLL